MLCRSLMLGVRPGLSASLAGTVCGRRAHGPELHRARARVNSRLAWSQVRRLALLSPIVSCAAASQSFRVPSHLGTWTSRSSPFFPLSLHPRAQRPALVLLAWAACS